MRIEKQREKCFYNIDKTVKCKSIFLIIFNIYLSSISLCIFQIYTKLDVGSVSSRVVVYSTISSVLILNSSCSQIFHTDLWNLLGGTEEAGPFSLCLSLKNNLYTAASEHCYSEAVVRIIFFYILLKQRDIEFSVSWKHKDRHDWKWVHWRIYPSIVQYYITYIDIWMQEYKRYFESKYIIYSLILQLVVQYYIQYYSWNFYFIFQKFEYLFLFIVKCESTKSVNCTIVSNINVSCRIFFYLRYNIICFFFPQLFSLHEPFASYYDKLHYKIFS